LLGIDERRLRLKWISASEGAAFAEEIRSFDQLLEELGDNPVTQANRSQTGQDKLLSFK
jgi:coenzyme F420-reducing hydrogenase delta subunit